MSYDEDIEDDNLDDMGGTDLAVVGVGCRFPGATTPDGYWDNLRTGKESVVPLSDAALLEAGVSRRELRDPAYVKAAAVLDDVDQFDAGFFGFSAREAQVLDPQHRFFLEVCWEALESAGHVPDNFDGRIGVFGGSGHNAYMPYNLFTNPKLMESMGLFLVRHTGNDKDFLTTRASYCLDLHGPAVNVQTACSTSLVAIHLAAQSLIGGECDMALAGGVTIELPHGRGYRFEEGEILSPDGHCRAFDHKSAGTVFGSGCGIVALRRLEDAIDDGDTIFAVVKSTAINNDGSRKVGYLAPSVDGQAEAIVEAITLAGLDARDISYVECHGTGTPVGDPIELTALTQAFRTMTEDSGFCRVGSVKTNIGHLDTAAGVASFIKVVQMLRHKQMAPTLHYEAPNPQIDFEASPFLVNDRLRPWTSPSVTRRAGVSSLGVGGTNAHIIVEEAPAVDDSTAPKREPQLLVVSGRTPSALEGNIDRLCTHLEALEPGDGRALADVAHTLVVGRRRFPYRRAAVVRTGADARSAFAEPDVRAQAKAHDEGANAPVAFLFPGGGAQFPGMMRELYDTEATFKDVLDQCLAIVKKREDIDLKPILFPNMDDATAVKDATAELKRATRALPALLSVEVALAALWEECGIQPSITIGHSLGEYAAAYLAGVFSLEDALGIVCCRGRLFEACPAGAMSAIPLSEDDIAQTLPAGLDIAVVNGPESCVVSGPTDALEAYEADLLERDIEARRLAIDVAAHSRMLDAVLEEFRTFLAKVTFSPPHADRPFVSNLSGAVADAEVATADYWVRHLRSTVRFSDGMASLLKAHPAAALLEVGPGQALTQISRMQEAVDQAFRAVPTGRHAKDDDTSELDHFLLAAGRLWCAGAELQSTSLFGEGRKRCQLPTYAFDHERHWVEPGDGFFMHAGDDVAGRSDDVGSWFSAPTFHPAALGAEDEPLPSGSIVLLADEGRFASRLAGELRGRGHSVVQVERGAGFSLEGDQGRIDPDSAPNCEALLVALSERGQPAVRIVNLWTLDDNAAPSGEHAINQVAVDAAAQHHLRAVDLLQAIESADVGEVGYVQLSRGGFAAGDDERVTNAFAALGLGPVRVAPKELPQLRAALVDIGDMDTPASISLLVDEILSPLPESLVLLRKEARFVEAWNAVHTAPAQMPTIEGAVVMTGGLGGIGRTIARAMAKEGVHFIMVGRTALPPRAEWDAYLETHDGGPVVAKLLAAQAIEAKGATVTTCEADVTDPVALRAALKSAAGSEPIRGVIHAAGTLDDKPLVLKTRPEMEAVLAPKLAGQLALEAAVDVKSLAFFVAFSSTSVPLGPPGQVDYVAANAFLNARMQALQGEGVQAKALGWGVWRDVGMAASANQTDVGIEGVPVLHPLLQRCAHRDATSVRYEALFSEDLWVLDEHRVRGQGAVVPGTALLEIVRAAAEDAFFPDAPLALHNVSFLRPLALDGHGPKKVVIEVVRDAAGATVRILSEGDESPAETLDHDTGLRAQGRVELLDAEPPAPVDLESLAADHPDGVTTFGETRAVLPQEQILDFGDRWNVLRSMRFGDGRAFATLALVPEVEADLEDQVIHAGLWDIASGFAFGQFPTPSADAIYVPVRYGEVRLYQSPPSKVWCTLAFQDADEPNRIRVDFKMTNAAGEVVAEVVDYEVAAVPAHALTPSRGPSAGPSLLEQLLEDGITEDEGVDAFARAFGVQSAVAIASPVDLDALNKAFAPAKVAPAPSSAPQLDVGGPRDDTERLVLGLFRDLLGAEHALITDSFFDLGGHSLIAVRLFSKIKKQTGVDLAIGTLFTTPTAETLAAAVREALGIAFEPDASTGGAPPAAATARGPACLVPIQPGPEDVRAFFCVHGAGGNVLNFADLSRHLGKDVPFYGLQAKGVDGKEEPLHSIEDMAESYLEGVRFARPHGPYVLGGYSGGGAVALEMAHRLVAEGETVETVVFLDTFRPGIGMKRPNLKTRMTEARREGLAYIPNKFKARFKRQWREASLEVQRRIFERAGAPPPIELREYQLTNAFAEAAERYSPPRYPGDVVMFRASETDLVYQHAGPTLGWGDLLDALTIHEVPGDHDSVTREPNIFEWVGRLRAIIVGEDEA